jgi:hypothetical protein
VVRFLSADWLAALDRAAGGLVIDPSVALCVEHTVDDVVYHVRYTDGRVRVLPGAADAPTVRVRADRATAAAIAQGALSAQRAFMQGQLRVEGDTLTLSTAPTSLRGLDDVFVELRASSDWTDV